MSTEREILEIKNDLVKMATFVEENIRHTYIALENKDVELLKQVVENDKKTNEMEKEIENRALRILVTYAPKANDFRLVTAILKIITDLERIGDHTEDICEIAGDLKFDTIDFPLTILEEMFGHVEKMLSQSMDSFIFGNYGLMEDIDSMDDIVDDLFIQLRHKIIGRIKEGWDPEVQLDLVQIGKYVERMGDHAENIAEWVVYEQTGIHPDLKKGDEDDLYS